MGFGGPLFRAIGRPFAAVRRLPALSPSLPHRAFASPPAAAGGAAALFRPAASRFPWGIFASGFNSLTFSHLTDTRFPKRRPGLAPRRKRASLRPKGPFAWIQSVPGEPVPTSQPNDGSLKSRRRKEKKRIRQRKEFIAAEVKKRKAAFAEHKRKKNIERIERKMAAVAREKAWAQRLIELQQRDAAKNVAQAS